MIATLWGQPFFTIRHKYCPFAYLVRAEVDSVVDMDDVQNSFDARSPR
jgi:hypothetical protein